MFLQKNNQKNYGEKGTQKRAQSYSGVKINSKAKGIKIYSYRHRNRQANAQKRIGTRSSCKYLRNLVYDKDDVQNNEKRVDYSLINVRSTGSP